MALDDATAITLIALVVTIAVAASAAVIFLMRRRFAKVVKAPKEPEPEPLGSPYRITKSVQTTEASHAKDELRILDLEREILGDAIRKLYEAHAEGKISEQERERLASSYKSRMMSVKESMAKDETIVALHELEGMQEDLMNLFKERLGELNTKVEELRTRIDIKPVKEIKIQMPKPQPPVVPEQMESEEEEAEEGEAEGEGKPKKPRKPPAEKPATPKTEAERRIAEMKSQVEKVLTKLDQIEIDTEA
ncbi:MAG: hypothetical protein ACE14S_04875 [Candidatus Bathyarchaeia archaeon]